MQKHENIFTTGIGTFSVALGLHYESFHPTTQGTERKNPSNYTVCLSQLYIWRDSHVMVLQTQCSLLA